MAARGLLPHGLLPDRGPPLLQEERPLGRLHEELSPGRPPPRPPAAPDAVVLLARRAARPRLRGEGRVLRTPRLLQAGRPQVLREGRPLGLLQAVLPAGPAVDVPGDQEPREQRRRGRMVGGLRPGCGRRGRRDQTRGGPGRPQRGPVQALAGRAPGDALLGLQRRGLRRLRAEALEPPGVQVRPALRAHGPREARRRSLRREALAHGRRVGLSHAAPGPGLGLLRLRRRWWRRLWPVPPRQDSGVGPPGLAGRRHEEEPLPPLEQRLRQGAL